MILGRLVLGYRVRRYWKPGIHELDYARWALNKPGNPQAAYCAGAKYIYKDDQETHNTHAVIFDYGDCELQFEVRGLHTGGEDSMALRGGNFIGVLFLGSNGYMTVEDRGFQTFPGDSYRTRP